MRINARSFQIQWKDEVGDYIDMSDSDDLLVAIEATTSGTCTLYIRIENKHRDGAYQLYILLFCDLLQNFTLKINLDLN